MVDLLWTVHHPGVIYSHLLNLLVRKGETESPVRVIYVGLPVWPDQKNLSKTVKMNRRVLRPDDTRKQGPLPEVQWKGPGFEETLSFSP